MECPVKNMTIRQKAVLGGVLVLLFGLVIGFGVGYKAGTLRARNGFLRERQTMMRQGFGANGFNRSGGRDRGMRAVPAQPQAQVPNDDGGAQPSTPTQDGEQLQQGAAVPVNGQPADNGGQTPAPGTNSVIQSQ